MILELKNYNGAEDSNYTNWRVHLEHKSGWIGTKNSTEINNNTMGLMEEDEWSGRDNNIKEGYTKKYWKLNHINKVISRPKDGDDIEE